MKDDPKEIAPASWDAFMHAHGGGFLQSWGWWRFQTLLGRDVEMRRMVHPRDESIVAQFLLVMLTLPFRQSYVYVPRGPVIDVAHASAKDAFHWFVDHMRRKVHDAAAAFGRAEFAQVAGTETAMLTVLEKGGFRPGTAMQPVHTVINDLVPDEAAQLAAMHSKTRYNIRVAERHGVTVREALYEEVWLKGEIGRFWKLLEATAERDGFQTHVRAYYGIMIAGLCPGTDSGDLKVRLWFAEHEGEPVAAALVAEYGDTATYLHGASAHDKRQLMAPYLLHWSIMRAAKAAGIAKYDFWGVAPTDDPKHPWAGITRFKNGFGGKHVAYAGAWELPGQGPWYTLYRYVKKFRG